MTMAHPQELQYAQDEVRQRQESQIHGLGSVTDFDFDVT